MFEIMTKADYFGYLDNTPIGMDRIQLKNAQDGFVYDALQHVSSQKIAEIGGGDSRVLKNLGHKNECWNIDEFMGAGNGPVKLPENPPYKISRVMMGDYSDQLPDNYFDNLFSVSVIEHVPDEALTDFFKDCIRILKPGGSMYHAIDIYLRDNDAEVDKVSETHLKRLETYIKLFNSLPVKFATPPKIKGAVYASASYTSNPDIVLKKWNQGAPRLAPYRHMLQSTSIKLILQTNK